MATVPAAARDAYRDDLCIAQAATESGVVPSRSAAADKMWGLWKTFCQGLGIDPLLRDIPDKVPTLQVFAVRLRSGEIAPKQNALRSRSVEEYLRAVGQKFTFLGAKDPRISRFSSDIDFRLQRQLRSYTKSDSSPRRVKPLPLSLLHHLYLLAQAKGDELSLAVGDLAYLAFFFLLRPGEYCVSTESHPFRLCDVQLFINDIRLDILTCSTVMLFEATFVTLTFTTQKNGTRDEVIGHARSQHSLGCPVLVVIRRIVHLRLHQASPSTPLCAVFCPTSTAHNKWCSVTAALVTATIRVSAAIMGPSIGFRPEDVSARSTRAGGAMALLCGKIDPDVIQLVGRWRSDTMLRYLTTQAWSHMRHLASIMASSGSFTVVPGQLVPASILPLLAQVPEVEPER
jgi:hypothetical protein